MPHYHRYFTGTIQWGEPHFLPCFIDFSLASSLCHSDIHTHSHLHHCTSSTVSYNSKTNISIVFLGIVIQQYKWKTRADGDKWGAAGVGRCRCRWQDHHESGTAQMRMVVDEWNKWRYIWGACWWMEAMEWGMNGVQMRRVVNEQGGVTNKDDKGDNWKWMVTNQARWWWTSGTMYERRREGTNEGKGVWTRERRYKWRINKQASEWSANKGGQVSQLAWKHPPHYPITSYHTQCCQLTCLLLL